MTGDKEGPGNSTSGCLSKETRNTELKRRPRPYVHCSIAGNSQDVERMGVCTDRQVDKGGVVHRHTYNGL